MDRSGEMAVREAMDDRSVAYRIEDDGQVWYKTQDMETWDPLFVDGYATVPKTKFETVADKKK